MLADALENTKALNSETAAPSGDAPHGGISTKQLGRMAGRMGISYLALLLILAGKAS
jgi:hypothetical protein